MSGLLLSEKISCAADFKILHCESEACTEMRESADCRHSFACIGGQGTHGRQKHVCVCLAEIAADAAPELIELGESEAVDQSQLRLSGSCSCTDQSDNLIDMIQSPE